MDSLECNRYSLRMGVRALNGLTSIYFSQLLVRKGMPGYEGVEGVPGSRLTARLKGPAKFRPL